MADLCIVKRMSSAVSIEIGPHPIPRVKARDDDIARSHRRNVCRHLFKRRHRHQSPRRIRDPQQLTRLREIRRHYIRMRKQLPHLRTEFRCIGRIELTVVSHDGIDNNLGILPLKTANALKHDLDLLLRTEKPCQQSIESQSVFCPIFHIGAHTRRIIVEIVIRESRMHGKYRRRERTCLHVHR